MRFVVSVLAQPRPSACRRGATRESVTEVARGRSAMSRWPPRREPGSTGLPREATRQR